MRWFRIDTFNDSWRPVYKVSRFFCLTTVSYNFIDRIPVRKSTDHTMLIVGILMCILLAYNSIETFQEQKFSLTDSNLISGGMFAYMMLFELAVISALIINYVNGFRAAKFFDIIEKADQQLSVIFGHRWNYQKEHFGAVAYLTFGYLKQMIFMQLLAMSSPPVSQFDTLQLLRIMIAFWWVMGCYQTMASITIVLLTTISKRFAIINAKMENHVKNYLMVPDKLENRRRKIRQFALMHAMLSDTVRLFNSCFSKQITFAIGCAFMFILFAIFGLIHAYAAVTANSDTFKVAMGNVLFSGFFQSFLFQLLVYSNRLNYECKRCSVIIQKVVSYGQYDRTILKECRHFSLQLMHHAPSVSCGMFDFDWELCYTMAGSITTYLVILLQFDFANLKMQVETI
ncbi:AAEL010274-PA, partial [Aedes aegypti]